MDKLEIIMVDPGILVENDWNTNIVDPDNEAKLDESLDRFGIFKPILVRELFDGTLQIIGGEHRNHAAKRKGLKEVPIINLGPIDDQRAREISLVDNGRYGADDTVRLSELLTELGELADLSAFLPYSDAELAAIQGSVDIDLDSLGIEDETPVNTASNSESAPQTHQTMRFRVPIADTHLISEVIERIIKEQGFCEADSMTNAGDALLWFFTHAKVSQS